MTSPSASSTPPTLPVLDGDDAWSTVWSACLRLVARRRSATAAQAGHGRNVDGRPSPALAWSPDTGWSLSGPFPTTVVERFALYKPLLDIDPQAGSWTIAHLGQSLDGYIATGCGDSVYVTGPENLAHLHRLRALCDAVIVGAGTVAADDPRLTTRLVPGSHPTRVVLDPALRAPDRARLFHDDLAPTLWLCDALHAAAARARVGTERTLGVPGLLRPDGSIDLRAALRALADRSLPVVLVEGGGVTVTRFAVQGCLDRLHLATAPVLIGQGRPGLRLPGANKMRDCIRPACNSVRMGADVLWDLDLGAIAVED